MYEDNIVARAGDGIHISNDIAGFTFLEGPLGRRNLTFRNNTFATVRGCGFDRSGGVGCANVCDNVSCVFSHVDPADEAVVHRVGNRATAEV